MPALRGLCFELRDGGPAVEMEDGEGEGVWEVLQRGRVLGREVRMEDVRGPIRVRLRWGEADGDGGGG